MDSLLIDNLDYFIIETLFPNYERRIDEIFTLIIKKTSSLIMKVKKKDLLLFNNKEVTDNITKDEILEIGLSILFELNEEEILDEINKRIENKLVSIIDFIDNEYYKLTNPGMSYFRKIWSFKFSKIIDLKVSFENFAFNPNYELKFPLTTLIGINQEDNKPLLIQLSLINLKESKISFRSVIKEPIFIKGFVNRYGIVDKIIKVQNTEFIIQNPLQINIVKIIELKQRKFEYIINLSGTEFQLKVKGDLIEPEIPLTEDYWYYNNERYLMLREGSILSLFEPIILDDYLTGFEKISVENEPKKEVIELVLDLFKQDKRFKDQERIALRKEGDLYYSIPKEDIENELGISYDDLSKLRIKEKKNGLINMLIEVDGQITFKERKNRKDGTINTYINLENCFIKSLNF